MTKEIIKKLKLVQNITGKVLIIGGFYAGLCFLISVFSITFAILMAAIGIILVLLVLVFFYEVMVEIQLIPMEELLKTENEEEDTKWRSQLNSKIKKEEEDERLQRDGEKS